MRNEPHWEPFRFEQPYEPRAKFRNEHPRNEPYKPPQNRRNRFGFHNNDRQKCGRNGYNDQDRNAYNAPKRDRDIFDRGTDSQRKKYWR